MDKPIYHFTVDGTTYYLASLEIVYKLGTRFVTGSTSLATCMMQLTEVFLHE